MANSKILLVEGLDDERVMMHICGNRDIPKIEQIKPLGSVEKLLENIPVQVRLSNEEGDVVGVVIDADTNLSARWHSIHHRIKTLGYQDIPDQPDPAGTILYPPTSTFLPRLGIWIMPNNQTKGILENFLQFLVPETDILLEYARKCVTDLPQQLFIGNDEPKVIIHTWLAWQAEPGKPYGTAITAKFLDPTTPEADVLVNWLNRLFFSHS